MEPEEMIERLGTNFPTGDVDGAALDEVRRRLRRARLARGVVNYSELVSGIAFRHGSFWDGNEHVVDTYSWTGLDRQMVGGILARLTVESLQDGGYMIGALVVSQADNSPSGVFFDWLHDEGVLNAMTEAAVTAFWVEQMNLAHADRR